MVDHAALDPPHGLDAARRARACAFFYASRLLVIPPLGLLPIFPAFWVFDQIDDWLGIVDRASYLCCRSR